MKRMASVFKRGGKRAKGYYYASWFDHTGKRRTKCTNTTDKASAERIARKYEAEAALRREGVIDPAMESIAQEAQRPIETHLADYEAKMKAAGRTAPYISRTIRIIREVCEASSIATAGDIKADDATRFAGQMQNEGKSARTVQETLTALKSFTKWLTEHQKLPRDPLAAIRKPNPKTDRRLERRMLLPDEWRHLQIATLTGPDRYGIAGDERALLYETAIQTGLRSNELRSLTRGQMHFDADTPYITCKAGSTKNRQEARQYISSDLAAALRTHVSKKTPKAPLFAMPHETNVARMLRADLAAARAAWLKASVDNPEEYAQREGSDYLAETSHEGEVIDFHSLRHTCGAWLAMTGAHPKVVQTMMRHQAITLTMDTYGHLFPGQESDALARLCTMMNPPADNPTTLAATGTDNTTPHNSERAQRRAQQSPRESGQNGATACDNRNHPHKKQQSPKPLRVASLGDDVRNRAGGTRTPGQAIMSRLL